MTRLAIPANKLMSNVHHVRTHYFGLKTMVAYASEPAKIWLQTTMEIPLIECANHVARTAISALGSTDVHNAETFRKIKQRHSLMDQIRLYLLMPLFWMLKVSVFNPALLTQSITLPFSSATCVHRSAQNAAISLLIALSATMTQHFINSQTQLLLQLGWMVVVW